jgi:hypothetical protein
VRESTRQGKGLPASAVLLAVGASIALAVPACRALEGLGGLTFDLTDGGGGASSVTVGTGTGVGVGGAGGTGVGVGGGGGMGGGNGNKGGSGGRGGSGGKGGMGGGPQCTTNAECATGNPCTIDACSVGKCTHTNVPNGPTPGVVQMMGTCQQEVCTNGVDMMVADDMNAPTSNMPCIVDSCMNGQVQHTNDPQGMDCGAMGKCNAIGQCVGCNVPADCGANTFCQTQTCTAGTCGTMPTAAGISLPIGNQTMGNCQNVQCDGMGNAHSVPDNTNLPTPATCTMAVCTNGVPSTPPVPAGKPGQGCMTMVCDGNGNCVQCVGDAQCKLPETCDGSGVANTCGCTSNTMAVTCSGKCGMVDDNCDLVVNCGDPCVAPQTCAGGGTANVCGCTDNPMATTCSGLCGEVADNCGMLVDCGTAQCVFPDECGGGGAPNVCGCTPDSGMGC